MLSLVDLLQNSRGQSLAIHLHRISVCGTIAAVASTDGHARQGIASLVPLLLQARDDALGGIIVVKRRAQLLSRFRKLLLELVGLEDDRIPLVLEGGKERRNRCEGWWPGLDRARLLQVEQVVDCEVFAIDGIGAVLRDVSLY